jgi:hypothetical protein
VQPENTGAKNAAVAHLFSRLKGRIYKNHGRISIMCQACQWLHDRMHDPNLPMFYRTEIAKWLMNNNHEPRPVDLNIKVIVQGIGPPASVSVEQEHIAEDHSPPRLN